MTDRTAPDAPGAPGIRPTWTSSAKDIVGCSLGSSRLWFTTGFGIVNEIYHPRVDIPQIRDLGLIVGDGKGFWVEVKRLQRYEVHLPAPGIPVVQFTHRHERFELILRLVPDPARDVLLLSVSLTGDEALRPYVLLAPHLGGTGHDNVAEAGRHRGANVLWATQGPFALALVGRDDARRDALIQTSAGYVGTSDGWQDFDRNGAMTWSHGHAGPGNVALTGALPRSAMLAVGFATSKESAATLAASALEQKFDVVWEGEAERWRRWHDDTGARRAFDLSDRGAHLQDALETSAMVLRVHGDKTYLGAMVASLSIPWGNSKDDLGGYHLVWPRDLVESAGALLALGAVEEARDVLRYLVATQNEDGRWFQNQWLGGTPYWNGVQLDEAAFPILLAGLLAERDALDGIDVSAMVRRAVRFLALTGPSSDQDRWEEDSGVNPFTLAVCVAALVTSAEFLDGADRAFALRIADFWNSRIEEWTTVHDTRLCGKVGVDRYYVRVAPPQVVSSHAALHQVLAIKNLTCDPGLPADTQVGGDFLQLVRCGLRRADDPVIRDSVKVVDDLLRVETPEGPAWHRYNGDGYGEHVDGSPFDGTGVGRAWPLLAGERGHYALAAGEDPLPYLEAMVRMTGPGGLMPEQVWDAAPLAGRGLFPGRPSGSAMPLVWAHAEYVKLAASIGLGRPFDRLEAVWARYHGAPPTVGWWCWSPAAPITEIPSGMGLCIHLADAAIVHWSVDAWQTVHDDATKPLGLGLHQVEIAAKTLAASPAHELVFTLRWETSGAWEGRDFRVAVR
ncbi:MAG TPA: glycoside hydrolase family 15 protein [Gemmatimonadales bacterium]|nr:glycoside hydrolase family 15 protein [Gemmatimonadales bacterium]